MSTFKRLVCLLICIILTFGCLASCNETDDPTGDGGTGGDGGEIQLDPRKYEAGVRVVFATNDDKMKDAVDNMSSSSVILADGDNLCVSTSAKTDSTSLDEKYTLIDGTLYHFISIASGEYTIQLKEKAEFTEVDRIVVLADAGTGAHIGISDFATCDTKGADGKYTYTCSDIKDDAKKSLEGILSDSFSSLDATVSISSVSFILEADGDFELNSVLSCNLQISMDGQIYEVTMRTYTDYDYEAEVNIEAPADADAYKDVPYEEII